MNLSSIIALLLGGGGVTALVMALGFRRDDASKAIATGATLLDGMKLLIEETQRSQQRAQTALDAALTEIRKLRLEIEGLKEEIVALTASLEHYQEDHS